MGRTARLVSGVVLLAAGAIVGLYGVALFLYRGEDGSGHTYVDLGGRRVDAQAVALVALTIAVIAVAAGLVLLRTRAAGRGSRNPT